MLTEDPLKRPSAEEILKLFKKTKYKDLVGDLPKLPKNKNIKKINKNLRTWDKELKKGSKTLDVLKAKGFAFPFENEDQNKIEFPFQFKKDEYDEIFKLNKKIKEDFTLKILDSTSKPQLLFDASSPSFFPILKESRVNPNPSNKKKTRRIPKITKIGNILDMISKETKSIKESSTLPQSSNAQILEYISPIPTSNQITKLEFKKI